MIKLRGTLLLSCMSAVLLSACLSTPNEQFYTLLGRSQQTNKALPSATPLTVAIAPITLPAAVDRRELVIRTGANRVDILDNHRWAESLKTAIPRDIAVNLSQDLGGASVLLQSDNISRDAKYVLLLDVLRFDSELNSAATVDVAWSVRLNDGTQVRSGRSAQRVPVQGASYDALVAAHAQALETISQEIAEQIKAL